MNFLRKVAAAVVGFGRFVFEHPSVRQAVVAATEWIASVAIGAMRRAMA